MCLWSVSSFTIPHLASPVPFAFTFTHSFTTSCLLCHQVRLLIAKGATINARNGCPPPALTDKNYRCIRGSCLTHKFAQRVQHVSHITRASRVTCHTSHVTRQYLSFINTCIQNERNRTGSGDQEQLQKGDRIACANTHARTHSHKRAHTYTHTHANSHTGDKVAQGKGRDLVRMDRVK